MFNFFKSLLPKRTKGVMLSPEQIAQYKKLHQEGSDKLHEVIGGKTDIQNAKPITHPQASCLVSQVIMLETRKLGIINAAEKGDV